MSNMDFNFEDALDALNNFEKEADNVSPLLEDYLQIIAKTGNILFPWDKLKPLLKKKIELVLTDFNKCCPIESVPTLPNTETFNFDDMKTNMLDAVDSFSNAPFTIQRLCELLVNPKKYYNRTDKYMRGLERNLLVVSTIDSNAHDSSLRNQSLVNGDMPLSATAYEETNAAESSVTICSTSSVNTVLENFATVFPSATRIAAPPNNIQVPVISDSNDFLSTECMGNFGYDVNDGMSTSEMDNDNLTEDVSEDPASESEDSKNLDDPEIENASILEDTLENSISSSNIMSTEGEISEEIGSTPNQPPSDFNDANIEDVHIATSSDISISQSEELISENEDLVSQSEGLVSQNQDLISQDEDHVLQNEDLVPQNEDVLQNEDLVSRNEDFVSQNEGLVAQNEDLEEPSAKRKKMDGCDGTEETDVEDQSSLGCSLLYVKVNEQMEQCKNT